MKPNVLCVEHRQGWCAVESKAKLSEVSVNVPTRCGMFVTLPYGFQKRLPTCKECLGKIR